MLSFCNEAGISRMTTQNDSSVMILLKSVNPWRVFLLATTWSAFTVEFVVYIGW